MCSELGETSDSQRSSVSYEEATYDGRQGSVTYSYHHGDDDEMMTTKSSAAESTHDDDARYHQPYVGIVCLSVCLSVCLHWLLIIHIEYKTVCRVSE